MSPPSRPDRGAGTASVSPPSPRLWWPKYKGSSCPNSKLHDPYSSSWETWRPLACGWAGTPGRPWIFQAWHQGRGEARTLPCASQRPSQSAAAYAFFLSALPNSALKSMYLDHLHLTELFKCCVCSATSLLSACFLFHFSISISLSSCKSFEHFVSPISIVLQFFSISLCMVFKWLLWVLHYTYISYQKLLFSTFYAPFYSP